MQLVNHLRVDGETAKILIAFVGFGEETKNYNFLANRKKCDSKNSGLITVLLLTKFELASV